MSTHLPFFLPLIYLVATQLPNPNLVTAVPSSAVNPTISAEPSAPVPCTPNSVVDKASPPVQGAANELPAPVNLLLPAPESIIKIVNSNKAAAGKVVAPINVPVSPKPPPSPISGTWSFNVKSSLNVITNIAVEITSQSIFFNYCNDVQLSYKIGKPEISIKLGSELKKVCPLQSPNESKVLASFVNSDSYLVNGSKLYLYSGGSPVVSLTKL